ncbi:MAG: hypothetical protein R2776_05695 [Flavobacteriaceae bacterium]|nr:hypothetical protein [Flavobacteriaceae bacterium]
MMVLLEGGYLDGLIYLVLAVLLGPAIILAIIGAALKKKYKKAAKVLFIIAVVYSIVSLGIFGALMYNK